MFLCWCIVWFLCHIFSTVHWNTLERTCRQRSWRCITPISSVTSETGERNHPRSRWTEWKGKLEMRLKEKQRLLWEVPTQWQRGKKSVWATSNHWNYRCMFWFLSFVPDSFVLMLWKPNIRPFTVRQQVPWCCWLPCTPATRWDLCCILPSVHCGTRLHLPDSVRMFWLSAVALVALIMCHQWLTQYCVNLNLSLTVPTMWFINYISVDSKHVIIIKTCVSTCLWWESQVNI